MGRAMGASDALASLFGPAQSGAIDQFAKLMARPSHPVSPFGNLDRKFVIGFTARVGSTLLCQNLIPYGVAISEFFNPRHITAETHIPGATDYGDLCARLVDTFGVNGAWGVKAHIHCLIPLFFVGEFPANLGSWRFVYLSRDNVVRQAVSQVIAQKQKTWSSWKAPVHEVVESDYSRDDIAAALRRTSASASLWQAFFAMFGIEPLRLTYEEVVADVAGSARRVADHCGLELGRETLVSQFKTPPVKPQSTAVNLAWERRFATESR
jgi:LPS sulfotransferase NodH